MTTTKVLVSGATGYIGGSILSHLLSSKEATKRIEIAVVIRNDKRAEYFSSLGLKIYPIKDLDDSEALRAAASENDVVIQAASGYHAASATALIEGLGLRKKRHSDAEVYFIHTSGTSNLADRPITRTFTESRDFSDEDQDIYEYLKRRESIEQYAQRTTDLAVVETGKKENVPTTIIMSPTIYGLGSGKFHRLTIQYPLQMRAAMVEGKASFVGDGLGKWDFVHVLDLAGLYEAVLLDWIEGRRLAPVGEKGIIFSATGSFTWKEVAERIAQVGGELKVLEDTQPQSTSLEHAAKIWVGGDEQLCELGFASNSSTKAVIGRRLGWTPTRTREDWEKSIREEFEAIRENSS